MKRTLIGNFGNHQINPPPGRKIIDEVYVRFSLINNGKLKPGQQISVRQFYAEGLGDVDEQSPGPEEE